MTPCQKLLKQEGTARRIESMQQSSTTPSLHLWFLGVAEDCCMLSILLAVPSCFNSFWHGVIPTSYFIFNDFYTCNYYGYNCFPSFKQFYTCDQGLMGIIRQSVYSLYMDDLDILRPLFKQKTWYLQNVTFLGS